MHKATGGAGAWMCGSPATGRLGETPEASEGGVMQRVGTAGGSQKIVTHHSCI